MVCIPGPTARVCGRLVDKPAATLPFLQNSQLSGSLLARPAPRDINKQLGFGFSLDGPKTPNGLLPEQLQQILDAPIAIKVGDCIIEVLHVQDQAIRVARLQRLPAKHTI